MSDWISKISEQTRKNMERTRLQAEGYSKVFEASRGVLTGNNSVVDVSKAVLEVKYGPDFAVGDKSAMEIVRELRVEKRSANYNGDSNTSKACRIVIDKYLPEAGEEAIAGE